MEASINYQHALIILH